MSTFSDSQTTTLDTVRLHLAMPDFLSHTLLKILINTTCHRRLKGNLQLRSRVSRLTMSSPADRAPLLTTSRNSRAQAMLPVGEFLQDTMRVNMSCRNLSIIPDFINSGHYVSHNIERRHIPNTQRAESPQHTTTSLIMSPSGEHHPSRSIRQAHLSSRASRWCRLGNFPTEFDRSFLFHSSTPFSPNASTYSSRPMTTLCSHLPLAVERLRSSNLQSAA